jgi:hypothetical protein
VSKPNPHPIVALTGRAYNIRAWELESCPVWGVSFALATDDGTIFVQANQDGANAHPGWIEGIPNGARVRATGHLSRGRRGQERIMELVSLEVLP